MENIPFTIIGGGICGVLTALKIKIQYPSLDVLLVEKEPYIGHHNTTRNSGVLHAGLYYPTDSLKHRLCRAGYNQWIQLASRYNIPINICGKYVIATTLSELTHLESVYLNAKNNAVPKLRKMVAHDFSEINDFVNTVGGFFSEQTGILDISSAINILRDEFEKIGGIIMMSTKVIEVKKIKNKSLSKYLRGSIFVKTTSDEFMTEHLINCAGAWAIDLRKQLDLCNIDNHFVKGNYLKLNKPYYNKKLIYPLPPKNLAGLGVHTSFHLDGIVRFGPNAEAVTEVSYSNSERNIEFMYPSIQKLFKNISIADLSPDYVGIRTKIIRNGQLYTDFLIQGPKETQVHGYHEALGIESPGMTAAPAIADQIIQNIKLHQTD